MFGPTMKEQNIMDLWEYILVPQCSVAVYSYFPKLTMDVTTLCLIEVFQSEMFHNSNQNLIHTSKLSSDITSS